MRLLARPRLARRLGTLVTEGYLAETGWVQSVLSDRIVGADAQPVPWMTRPFIDFVAPRLSPGLRIFEYGSGASTLFFGRFVSEVVAVEHDEAFARVLARDLPANARLLIYPRGSDRYVWAVREMKEPDIVTVDGMDRPACAAAAIQSIPSRAVVVLDDSQLEEYRAVYVDMKAAGFRALDFWGLAAGRVEHRCTTVFYRDGNVLGI